MRTRIKAVTGSRCVLALTIALVGCTDITWHEAINTCARSTDVRLLLPPSAVPLDGQAAYFGIEVGDSVRAIAWASCGVPETILASTSISWGTSDEATVRVAPAADTLMLGVARSTAWLVAVAPGRTDLVTHVDGRPTTRALIVYPRGAARTPAEIIRQSPSAYSAAFGSWLSPALSVRVVTREGVGVPGATVMWIPRLPGAQFSNVVTDGDGVASLSWQVNTGHVVVSAAVQGLTKIVDFTITSR